MKDWFKYRGYPHISNEIPFSKRTETYRYVSSPKKVASHKFLPFIRKTIVQRRYKRIDGFKSSKRGHTAVVDGVSKPTHKLREIMFSCHMDAHVYSYYAKKLIEPKYESVLLSDQKLNESVTAYRSVELESDKSKHKSNLHFAREVVKEIENRRACTALLFDIKDFFPSLNHKRLKQEWSKLLGFKSLPRDHYNVFKSITNYSFINQADLRTEKGTFDEKILAEIRNCGKNSFFHSIRDFLDSDISIYKNNKKGVGIPQGLPISALLANIYMLEFDKKVIRFLGQEKQVFYRRYSDDMIFISEAEHIERIKEFVQSEMDEIGLKISKEKTEIFHFKESTTHGMIRLESYAERNGVLINNIPLSYLGIEFYGYQTLLKSKNLASFYREMKEGVATKSKRIEKIKAMQLLDEAPLFKRKIYRLYSYNGKKSRLKLKGGREVRFRGNFISYALRASEIMDAPEIRHQIRNHFRILKRTIDKYEFSNNSKSHE